MEFWKAVFAIIPAGYFIMTNAMQEAVFTMVMFLILDTLTGWIKSTKWFCGGFSSTKMFNFRKMICYMVVVLLAFQLTKLPYLEDSFVYVCAWLSLREAWSVIENLSEMKMPFPKHIIEKIVSGVNEDNNK